MPAGIVTRRRSVLTPAAVGGLAAYAAVVLADSPAGYWPMISATTTETDYTGNSRTLTWGATPTLSSPALVKEAGVSDSASYEGTVAHGTWLDQNAFTVEFWMDSAATGADLFAIADRRVAVDLWAVYINRTNGRLKLLSFKSGAGGPTTLDAGSGNTLDGALHHCVVVHSYTGSNIQGQFYIDGSSLGAASTMYTGTAKTSASESLHVLGEGGTRRYSGEIAHLAYYPTALSGATIAAHYTAGTT